MTNTFHPGEIVRFRFVAFGTAPYTVIDCNGCVVTVTDGRDTFTRPIGEFRRG